MSGYYSLLIFLTSLTLLFCICQDQAEETDKEGEELNLNDTCCLRAVIAIIHKVQIPTYFELHFMYYSVWILYSC